MQQKNNLVKLAAIQDYMYCPMLYYWQHDAQGRSIAEKVDIPVHTSRDLPKLVITSALKAWTSEEYGGHPFFELARDVWRVWFAHYEIRPDVITMLERYAEERNVILDQFLTGKIRRNDGSQYVEPRLTNRYRDMLEMAGLSPIPLKLEEHLQPVFGVAKARLPKLGEYYVADAYCDSLLMAARYAPPAVTSIIALQEPVSINVNGMQVEVVIDLLLEGADGLIAEVHDQAPIFYFDRRRARVDLRMVAIAAAAEKWERGPLRLVRYRHFQSAQELDRKALRLSRLSFALATASRAIEGGIYLPAFLGGDLGRCMQCPAKEQCLGENEDVYEHYVPGLVPKGERNAEHLEREKIQ